MPCWRSDTSAPHLWHVAAGAVWKGAVLGGGLCDAVIVADIEFLKCSSREHEGVRGFDFPSSKPRG